MIPEHVMRELRYIEVYTGKRIRNLRVGPYTSPQRGPGFDFDEHQPYRHGDDVRRIDWNVTARMGAPFVRHTHAERELNVMIAIDVSRSMELGAAGRSKKELMTFITGSLLFSAVSDQINTGFLAFSDRVLEYSPPRRTRAAAWSVLDIWHVPPPYPICNSSPWISGASANPRSRVRGPTTSLNDIICPGESTSPSSRDAAFLMLTARPAPVPYSEKLVS